MKRRYEKLILTALLAGSVLLLLVALYLELQE
jgi:hypothetical protein